MRFGREVIHGLISSLLLFSVVVAVHQNIRGWAPAEQAQGALDSGLGSSAGGTKGRPAVPAGLGSASSSSPWSLSAGSESFEGDAEPATAGSAGSAQPGSLQPSSNSTSHGAPARSSGEGSSSSESSGRDEDQPSGVPSSGDGAAAAQGGGQVAAKTISFGESRETACGSARRDFFLESLRDLHVCVAWQGLAGTYVERLTFLTPNGNIYQALNVAFATSGTSAPAGGVEVEGRKLDVTQSGLGAQGEALVVAQLPVAGTFITQHNLVGLWTVEVSLNGRVIDRATFVFNKGG